MVNAVTPTNPIDPTKVDELKKLETPLTFMSVGDWQKSALRSVIMMLKIYRPLSKLLKKLKMQAKENSANPRPWCY